MTLPVLRTILKIRGALAFARWAKARVLFGVGASFHVNATPAKDSNQGSFCG